MIKSPFNKSSVFTVDADSKKAVVRAVFSNALAPMLVTDDGIAIVVKPVMPWNALAPIPLTEEGIVTDVTLAAP